MKNYVILCIVVALLGGLFYYILPEQEEYYQVFHYNTDDYADEYYGLFSVSITDSILMIQDTTDDVLIFYKTNNGLWKEDGMYVTYELIQTDRTIVLQGRNEVNESITLTNKTY